MDTIVRSVESDPRSNGLLSSIFYLLSESGGKSAILFGVCAMTVQAFSGSVVVITYGQTIFEKIQDVQLQEPYTAIVLATVHLISYLVCVILVDRLRRKPLMIISTVIC